MNGPLPLPGDSPRVRGGFFPGSRRRRRTPCRRRRTGLLPPAVAAFLLTVPSMFAAPATAQAQTPVWSATLTVARPASGSDALGYCRGAANCSAESAHYGALSEPGFSIGEMGHTVTSIRWGAGGEGNVHLTLDSALSAEDMASLVLHLGDVALNLAEARVNAPAEHGFTANYTWDGSGSVPEEASTIDARLTRSPGSIR